VALNKKSSVVCECDKNRGIRVGLSTWSPICPTQPNLSYNPNDPIRRLVSFLETPPPPLSDSPPHSHRATPSITNYGTLTKAATPITTILTNTYTYMHQSSHLISFFLFFSLSPNQSYNTTHSLTNVSKAFNPPLLLLTTTLCVKIIECNCKH